LLWLSISPKQTIPEEIDHRKIFIGVVMMNEMKFLLFSEPRKSP
jgi:hypothetical protein